jgi:hypothetical protein
MDHHQITARVASKIGIEMPSVSLPADLASIILISLWCTTEKKKYYKYKYNISDIRFVQIS